MGITKGEKVTKNVFPLENISFFSFLSFSYITLNLLIHFVMWDSNMGDCNFRDNKMSTVFDTSHSLFWGSQDLGHETLKFM